MELSLLVEVSEPQTGTSIILDGRRWQISSPYHATRSSALPSLCCISYLWGAETERVPHPFDPATMISSRTFHALEAAIRASTLRSFWIDGLCVPSTGPQRQATLESMGAIYSLAGEVVIVVASATFRLMRQLAQHGTASEEDLETLERDRWISSIWTYQELANSCKALFVSLDSTDSGLIVEAANLLNGLGNALQKLQARLGVDDFVLPMRFPHLNALDEILADWMTSSLDTRSAFGVFSMMAHKRNADPVNYIYALLGALTTEPAELRWEMSELELQEKLMRVCEQKRDYSFIFTIAPRDADPKRRWRPRPTPLTADGDCVPVLVKPPFVWHCWGDLQRGHEDLHGLHLEDIAVMKPCSSIGAQGKTAVAWWLGDNDLAYVPDAELCKVLYERLSALGFSGSALPIYVDHGIVFAQQAVCSGVIDRIFISTQIRWQLGAPGLLSTYEDDKELYIPCMFIGRRTALAGGTITMSANPHET